MKAEERLFGERKMANRREGRARMGKGGSKYERRSGIYIYENVTNLLYWSLTKNILTIKINK